jgi:hypothetical protein
MSSIPDRTPPVLHLRGTVVIDDPREVGEAWVVGGRITLTRATGAADAVLLEGWVLPGLGRAART